MVPVSAQGMFDASGAATITTAAQTLNSNDGSIFVLRFSADGVLTSGMNCGCDDTSAACEMTAMAVEPLTNTVYVLGCVPAALQSTVHACQADCLQPIF